MSHLDFSGWRESLVLADTPSWADTGSPTQPRYNALKDEYARHEAFSFLHTVALSRSENFVVPEIVVVGAPSAPKHATGISEHQRVSD